MRACAKIRGAWPSFLGQIHLTVGGLHFQKSASFFSGFCMPAYLMQWLVCRYPSGARYEGAWWKNVKHGWGVYHYADGGKFEGFFKDGQRSGLGVRTWPAGNAKVASHSI